VLQSPANKPSDVFQEDPFGFNFANDTLDVRPDPALVFDPELLARGRPGLAGEAGRDDIHAATPRSPVEGGEVVPDRSRIQGLVCHPRHEGGCRVGFPLDVHHAAVVIAEGDVESEFESAGSGTPSCS
jgi:hypothetical protein